MGCRNLDLPRGVRPTPRVTAVLPAPVEEKKRTPEKSSTAGDECPFLIGPAIGPPLAVRIPHDRWQFERKGEWGGTGIQGYDYNGKRLCLCGCGRPVPKGARTKATATCWQKWAAIYDPAYIRNMVAARDRYVCAKCRKPAPGNWEADHIIPVIEGGGCCGLEGMRTLCLPCHREATAALATRRALKRRAGAEQTAELTLSL